MSLETFTKKKEICRICSKDITHLGTIYDNEGNPQCCGCYLKKIEGEEEDRGSNGTDNDDKFMRREQAVIKMIMDDV